MKNAPLYLAHPSAERSGKQSHVLTEPAEQRLRDTFRSDERNYVQTLCNQTLLDGDYRTVACDVADGHLWALGVKLLDLETKVSCPACRGKLVHMLARRPGSAR